MHKDLPFFGNELQTVIFNSFWANFIIALVPPFTFLQYHTK